MTDKEAYDWAIGYLDNKCGVEFTRRIKMTNEQFYNMAIDILEKHFGRGVYCPEDVLKLIHFLKRGE